MPNDFVEKTIKRLNLNTILFSLFFLLLVIGIAGLSWRYIHNFLYGPFPISRNEILSLSDPAARKEYYVTVQSDDNLYTGYDYVSTDESGKDTVEAYYHVVLLDYRLLLVKARTDAISNTIIGSLVKLTSIESEQVIPPLEAEVPEIKGAFLPFMLDASNFKSAGYLGLVLGGIVALAALVGIGVGLFRYDNPYLHPAIKALKPCGETEMVVQDINLSMNAPHTQVGKNVHFTERWMVSAARSFAAARHRDIIWAYKKVTQHRTNGIPTGKTYAALVFDRYGREITMPGKELEVDAILQNISQRAPGTVCGYSEEMRQAWKSNRAAVIAHVDEARRNAGMY